LVEVQQCNPLFNRPHAPLITNETLASDWQHRMSSGKLEEGEDRSFQIFPQGSVGTSMQGDFVWTNQYENAAQFLAPDNDYFCLGEISDSTASSCTLS
jgi:hypothetical protein